MKREDKVGWCLVQMISEICSELQEDKIDHLIEFSRKTVYNKAANED